MLKIAIVGCGGIAEVHALSLQSIKGVEMIAHADIVPERARAFAEAYGGNAYTCLDELLAAEKPDALHICTPHYLHVSMAVKAHSKGIHVFLEKPPATTRSDLTLLEDTFGGGEGARLGVCFQNRYIGSFRHVKRLLDEKAYGTVKGARAFVTWSRSAPYYTESGWRGSWATEGGGVLVNQSIHTLDLLVFLLGKAKAVEAGCSNRHLKGIIQVEDTVDAYIDFGGAKSLFYATTAYCTDSPVMVEVVCENGTVRMEGNTVTEYPPHGAPKATEHKMNFLGKEYWGAGHLLCIEDFYRCLEAGEKFPVELADVRDTLDLMMGIYESAATRQVVELK